MPGGFGQAPQLPSRQIQGLLAPLDAVQVTVTVQRSPRKDVWCFHLEARDFTTGALVALYCQPSRTDHGPRGVAQEASTELEDLLAAMLDPDPF